MRVRGQDGKWMRDKRPPPPKAKPNGNGAAHDEAPEKAQPLKITPEMIARARNLPNTKRSRRFQPPPNMQAAGSIFAPAEMPPSVFPKNTKQKLGMDAGFSGIQWAQQSLDPNMGLLAAYDLNVGFYGYAYLSVLAQVPEFRNAAECVATEMTRKWIRFHSRGDGEKEKDALEKAKGERGRAEQEQAKVPAEDRAPLTDDPLLAAALGEYAEARMETDEHSEDDDKIRELEDAFERLGVRDTFAQIALNDSLFGRSHIYVDIGEVGQAVVEGEADAVELKTDIGDGRGEISKAKVGQTLPVTRLVSIEPMWAYPANYNSNNPIAKDWYKPTTWYVQSQEIHRSRFLTFVSRPVPDMLKPAFAFGGLSLTQMMQPTVENWLRTRQGVSDIINAFSVFVLATNLGQTQLQNGAEYLGSRAALFNSTRDNSGLFVMDKDTEDFLNIAAPLGTLDVLQAQSQEHMCSVARIPIVKLLGVQPAGLNADSEGIIRTWYDSINAAQERVFRPNLQSIFWLIQLSLWGEVDEDITFSFEPLWELDELQKSQKRKTDADTAKTLVDAGILDPEEDRERLANDPDTPYANIDPEEVPEPPEPEGFGMGMGAGFGAGGPGGQKPPGPPSPPAGGNKPPPANGGGDE